MSDFEQCPHEAIRATCPAPCGCRCESCLAIAERNTEAPMTDDRAEMQERRKHGLKARHETRVERAIRRQVAEEIAAWADDLAAGVMNPDKPYNQGFIHASQTLARKAREIGAKETS